MKHGSALRAIPVLVLLAAVLPAGAHHGGHSAPPGKSVPASAEMSDAAMKEAVEAWYSARPIIGSQGTTGTPGSLDETDGVDVTVFVGGTQFNADGNGATQIDTVKILVGQTVRWQWQNGFHTVTSGTGASDPNAGLIFDQPIDLKNTSFTFTFTTPELVPYFCQPHEFLDMKGFVKVSEPVDVPSPTLDGSIGFAAAPWPNPSSAGLQFRFQLNEPGHVRADVIDARGRFVATVLDRAYDAGVHGAAWDGVGLSGRRVPAGHYFLRLRVPGFVGSRSFVMTK